MRAGRFRLASPLTASVLAGLVVALVGLLFLVAGLTGQLALSSFYAGFGVLAMVLVIAAVGLVVARNQPGSAIGWLLLGTSLWLLLTVDTGSCATFVCFQGHEGLPLVAPVALVLSQLFNSALITFPLVILLFPDGRLPSPRWRWATWIYLALVTAATLSVAAVAISAIAGRRVALADPAGRLHLPGCRGQLGGPRPAGSCLGGARDGPGGGVRRRGHGGDARPRPVPGPGPAPVLALSAAVAGRRSGSHPQVVTAVGRRTGPPHWAAALGRRTGPPHWAAALGRGQHRPASADLQQDLAARALRAAQARDGLLPVGQRVAVGDQEARPELASVQQGDHVAPGA
jgi:hypothetical protein